jgi:hypothetical protein
MERRVKGTKWSFALRLLPDPIARIKGSAGRKFAPHLSQDAHTVARPELIIEGMIKSDPVSGAAGRGIIGIAILVRSITGLIAGSSISSSPRPFPQKGLKSSKPSIREDCVTYCMGVVLLNNEADSKAAMFHGTSAPFNIKH